jgi:hypothetical protein
MSVLFVCSDDSMTVIESQSAVDRFLDTGLFDTTRVTLVALGSDAKEWMGNHTDEGNAGGKPEDARKRCDHVVAIVSRLWRIPFNSIEDGGSYTVADSGA